MAEVLGSVYGDDRQGRNRTTYLCGLLEPKVKTAVEPLPFTAEGYNRAKSILLSNYGKESEITKAFVKEIIGG